MGWGILLTRVGNAFDPDWGILLTFSSFLWGIILTRHIKIWMRFAISDYF
jgi:hypothetical protein